MRIRGEEVSEIEVVGRYDSKRRGSIAREIFTSSLLCWRIGDGRWGKKL
jgi:hypothetical protein